MSTKVFNTRLQLKYAPYSEWSAEANQFKLLAGEIAIVNVPAETGAVVSEPSILFKVGDGEKTFNQLPWASGLAADVYGWAKAETKPEYAATEISLGDSTVAANIADIWAKLEVLTGEESGNGNSITDMIQNGIDTFADSLGTAAYADTADFDAAGTAAALIKQLTDSLGTAAYEDKAAFDAAGEAAKVLGTDADVAGTATVHGALKSAVAAAQAAADANANAETRVKTTDFEAFKTTNTEAINEAASAGTTAAAGVQDNLDAYIESNDADLDAVRATANAAAKKADVDSAFEAVNAAIEALEDEAATHAKQADLEAEVDRATKAEAKALEDAKAYTDNMKNAILGEGIKDTFDTLKEIQDWIETDGVNATELTTAIAAETKAREEADTALSNRIKAYEDVKDTYATVSALEEVEAIADAARTEAEVDAQIDTKITALDLANTYDAKGAAADAETNANAYTDEKVGALHTVATSGKLGDLENEGRATTANADYVIFYCGTASILTSPEVTE